MLTEDELRRLDALASEWAARAGMAETDRGPPLASLIAARSAGVAGARKDAA